SRPRRAPPRYPMGRRRRLSTAKRPDLVNNEGPAMYFTRSGPKRGPILNRDRLDAISVTASADDPMPIGMALGRGWDAEGLVRFRLIVHGVEVPGRWSVVDRQFSPAKPPGPGSSD